MELKELLSDYIEKHRVERVAKSGQQTLGDLINKFEACSSLNKKVVFDFGKYTITGIGSWRWSYEELSFHFIEEAFYPAPKASDLLTLLREAVGKTFEGFKGGDFLMTLRTPLWVANRGDSGCFYGEDYSFVGVIGLEEEEDKIILKTAKIEY